jgi:hypothetical protein
VEKLLGRGHSLIRIKTARTAAGANVFCIGHYIIS